MVSDLTVSDKEYNFVKYDKEIGHSGQLLVAVNKKDSNDRWIIKYKVISDVFAEFLFSNISNDLGLSVPECRLGKYRAKPAVYIKYIEDLRRLSEKEYNDEVSKRIVLSSILGNDDRFEFYCDRNNKIWHLDNAWCFYDETIFNLIRHKNRGEANLESFIKHIKFSRLDYIKADFKRASLSVKNRNNNNELIREVLTGVVYLDNNKYKNLAEIISLFVGDEIGEIYYNYILEVIKLAKIELSRQ